MNWVSFLSHFSTSSFSRSTQIHRCYLLQQILFSSSPLIYYIIPSLYLLCIDLTCRSFLVFIYYFFCLYRLFISSVYVTVSIQTFRNTFFLSQHSSLQSSQILKVYRLFVTKWSLKSSISNAQTLYSPSIQYLSSFDILGHIILSFNFVIVL